MASSYALPSSAIPQHFHQHSAEHLHSHSHSPSHSHSHSHSPSPLSSLSPSRKRRDSRAATGSHSHSHGHGHSHSRNQSSHSHSHSHEHTTSSHVHNEEHHEHNHAAHESNSNISVLHQSRLSLPPPLAPSSHWRTDSTPGGKPLVTPTDGSFDEIHKYEPPAAASGLHTHHEHSHHDHSTERSRFTNMLLPYTSKWPLIHTVMTEKDSRRIFYFMSLNLSFMFVQAFYGYVTDSLGLLSDSIHMFFDCVALAVGLLAAVASKWPPSERFPYGFGKIETLSGFGNGVFLILISVEIMFEAVERVIEGRETQRLGELFMVSTMGLLVNLVGMMAFGHHHHGGHDHGHSHGHSHDGHSHGPAKEHNHDHCDSHNHDHDHDHNHDHDHPHDHDHHIEKKHDHSHAHSHDNENMHGIYLHVLADTLGSAAVIVSTVLTHFWPWSGWDPLASFLIAVLILLSSLPLVKSSARRLLLTIPAEIEYNLRETLSGISGLRGVAGYAVPKFWIDDRNAGEDAPPNKLLGVMHVVAVRGADMEDVRDRVRNYLLGYGIDVTLQVEREGDTSCWCGVGRSPLSGGGLVFVYMMVGLVYLDTWLFVLQRE
ncbi:cation efflux family-domain-containing protein [Bombardia bombarda]|uniref:Zinc transporter n=1 Tax=Bombardia bombarda TaxID=252184 RepID=A0AA39XP49_9PEZI|nr:cation efflux family-domain-containing protein [Bombardia bombarda]